MTRRRRHRLGTLIAIAVAAAALGGTISIAVGKVAGWLGGGETVILERATGSADAVEPVAASSGAKLLVGSVFDPAAIYRERSVGVVTIYALFPRHADGNPDAQAQ